MPPGPIFPTGPGKPYMQKMEKHTRLKIVERLFLFFKNSFTVFDLISYCCYAAAHS